MIPEFEMEAEYGNNEYPGVSVVFLSSNTATNGESEVIVKKNLNLDFRGLQFLSDHNGLYVRDGR